MLRILAAIAAWGVLIGLSIAGASLVLGLIVGLLIARGR